MDQFLSSGEKTHRSKETFDRLENLKLNLIEALPKFGSKWDTHLPLFNETASIARILWFSDLYKKIIEVNGDILEFGSQWGASLSTFLSLMNIYEPYNPARRLISFSTFEDGFSGITNNDGEYNKEGNYSTSKNWDQILLKILNRRHPNKQIVINNGDATKLLPEYLEKTDRLIALVHFDMDIYYPTIECLKLIWPKMQKGSIVVFDELNCDTFPGETKAVIEYFGDSVKFFRSNFQPYSSYVIKE